MPHVEATGLLVHLPMTHGHIISIPATPKKKISPEEAIRAQVEEIIGKNRFNLIYMDADLEFCKKNDKYGLYQKAEDGKLKNLPGVDMVYEVPEYTTLSIKAESNGDHVREIIKYLENKKIFPL
jgi:bifunctional enzyme CysN/CysC